MYKLTPEKRDMLVWCLGIVVAKLSFVAVMVLVGFQIYVRWSVNQQFTFLGGFELEALTFSTFALIIALLYLHRPNK